MGQKIKIAGWISVGVVAGALDIQRLRDLRMQLPALAHRVL